MKIGFSTLGCPGWSWDEIIASAKDMGFDGIEIRGIGNEIFAPKAQPFLDKNIETTKQKIKHLNIEICCLTSSCVIGNEKNAASIMHEAGQYVSLASRLGVKYIRVLGDKAPQPSSDVDIKSVIDHYNTILKEAKKHDINVLVETNGVFANSQTIGRLMKNVEFDNCGILWDVHHTYRFFNEDPQYTFDSIGKYIKHVHVKDSLIEESSVKYKLLGQGDIPVKAALTILKNHGYDGYVCLEWVKRWCSELEEPGIVFSHAINYLKNI